MHAMPICLAGSIGGFIPKGPKGQKRPADMIGNAVKVMQIATGEEEYEDDGKDPAAEALGKKGGAARAKKLTPERRSEIGDRPEGGGKALGSKQKRAAQKLCLHMH